MRWLAGLSAAGAVALMISCSAPEHEEPGSAAATRPPARVWDLMTLVRSDRTEPSAGVVQSIAAWREQRSAVVSPLPAALSYPVDIPADAVLDLGYAVTPLQGRLEDVPSVRFRVVLTDHGDAEHVLLDGIVDVRERVADQRWFDARVDLAPWAGVSGTLSFRAEPDQPHSGAPPALALFSAPRVLPRAGPEAPSVLLVTIDCLRADHVHANGYRRQTTPAIDRLAAEGVRFAHAYTGAPMTFPSIPQLFTSKPFPSPGDATWLAPVVAAGVPSAAIVNNVFIELWANSRDPNALDSFDRLVGREYVGARAVTDEAIAWLDRHRDGRFALYLHYLDAHSPYRMVPTDADVFGDPSYRGPVTRLFNDVGAPEVRYTPADRQRVVDWYDAGVRWIDANLGRLIDHLRADGRLDHTIVVVTADHGEEFWDHGRFFHGQTLYDELLHVPLVVRLPRGEHAGTVVERAVRSIDVAPAVLEWAKLEAPGAFAGQSLARSIADPSVPAEPLVATATVAMFPTRYAVRTPGAKLVDTVDDGERLLFDLGSDPGERTNVLYSQLALARELDERLTAARGELWHRGFELRVVGAGGGYRLRLQGLSDASAFATLDRAGASGPRLEVGSLARDVHVEGVAQPEAFALRFDRQGVDPKGDRVEIGLDAEGVAEVRLGADGRSLSGTQLDLLAPELLASAEPPCPAPATGVRVCLWRWPRAEAASSAAPDAETRERLRALGYVR